MARAGALVLLALLGLIVGAHASTPLQADCALLELLPTDLTESISFIQPDGQAHFQGSFFVDFQKENHHNITFDLKFNTTFRFYVAPHEIDIDLWLYPIGESRAIGVLFLESPFCFFPNRKEMRHLLHH